MIKSFIIVDTKTNKVIGAGDTPSLAMCYAFNARNTAKHINLAPDHEDYISSIRIDDRFAMYHVCSCKVISQRTEHIELKSTHVITDEDCKI